MSERDDELGTYEAPVKCVNCAYRGPATIPVGVHIWGATCPVCQVDQRLRPDNEFRDEDREWTKDWLR